MRPAILTLVAVAAGLALPVGLAGVGSGLLLKPPALPELTPAVARLGQNLLVPLTLVAAFSVVRGMVIGHLRLNAVVALTQIALAAPVLYAVALAGFAFMDAPRVLAAALVGGALLLPATVAEASLGQLRRGTPFAWPAHLGAGALAGVVGQRTNDGWFEYWWEPAVSAFAAAPYLAVLAPGILRNGQTAVLPVARAAAVSLTLAWILVSAVVLAAGFPLTKALSFPLAVPEYHVPRSVRLARYDALKHSQPDQPLRIGRHRYNLPAKHLKTLNPSYSERLPHRYTDVAVELPMGELVPRRRDESTLLIVMTAWRHEMERFDTCRRTMKNKDWCRLSFAYRDLRIDLQYPFADRDLLGELEAGVIRYLDQRTVDSASG